MSEPDDPQVRRHPDYPSEPRSTPAERSLRARAAAYRLHSHYDSCELTSNARAAFNDRFARQVDPDNVLSVQEHARRAKCARKAYYLALAARSASVRKARTATRSSLPKKE